MLYDAEIHLFFRRNQRLPFVITICTNGVQPSNKRKGFPSYHSEIIENEQSAESQTPALSGARRNGCVNSSGKACMRSGSRAATCGSTFARPSTGWRSSVPPLVRYKES